MARGEVADMAVVHAGPGRCPVAGVALLRCDEVVRGFARGADAIVASRTTARNAGMVELHRSPGRRRKMAIITSIGRGDVARVLARRRNPVVAC